MEAGTARKGVGIISFGLMVMTVTHTLTHVFQRIHLALFPVIRTEFSLSLRQLGVIAAIPPLCQALLSIPIGLLSDRFGAKRMILVSLCVAAFGSFFASRTLNPLMLTVAVSLVYMNTAIYHPAAYSFSTRLVRPRDRSKALGVHGAGGTFGMAIGPISVSLLMGFLALSWRQVYLFWAFPMLIGIVVALRIRHEPTEDAVDDSPIEVTQPNSDSLLSLSLVMFLAFIAIRTAANQMVNAFLPIYLVDEKGLSEVLSSLIYGSSSLLGLIAAPVGGLLATRFGEKRWLLAALSLCYLSLGIAVMIPNVAAFIALYLSYGFCNTLGMAANSAMMAWLSPSRRRGLGYALFFLPGSIMGAVAPIAAAHVADAFGLYSIFVVALAVYVVGLVVLKLGVKV